MITAPIRPTRFLALARRYAVVALMLGSVVSCGSRQAEPVLPSSSAAGSTQAEQALPTSPSAWVVDRYGIGYSREKWLEDGNPGLDAGGDVGLRCFERSPSEGTHQVQCL